MRGGGGSGECKAVVDKDSLIDQSYATVRLPADSLRHTRHRYQTLSSDFFLLRLTEDFLLGSLESSVADPFGLESVCVPVQCAYALLMRLA